MECNKSATILSALIISLGIFGSGIFIGKGFSHSKLLNRTVSVKGISERDVKSDLGIWEIDYREISGNLIDVNKKLQHDQELVTAFLKQRGFTDQELSVRPVKVEDRLANVYSEQSTNAAAANARYVVTSGVRVRSTRVELIQQASTLSNALLEQGISLTFEGGSVSPNPSFYFTKLDKIRPEMMAEATRSAYTVAAQFAVDSNSKLKGISRANQGVFQIMSADSSTLSADWSSSESALGSIDKKVRLVTTIEYRLR
jgi:hypothetical protein